MSGTTPVKPHEKYSTWLVTIAASELYEMVNGELAEISWVEWEEELGTINKEKLHRLVRTVMRQYNEALPPKFRFNFDEFHTALFIERPTIVPEQNKTMPHAHFIFQYDGSDGRGMLGSTGFERWLRLARIPATVTIYTDPTALRPLSLARKTIHQYLTNPRKGFIDLSPSFSKGFTMLAQTTTAQYVALLRNLKRPCDLATMKAYVLGLETIPRTAQELMAPLETIVDNHKQLEHEDKSKWRETYEKAHLYKSYMYSTYINLTCIPLIYYLDTLLLPRLYSPLRSSII